MNVFDFLIKLTDKYPYAFYVMLGLVAIAVIALVIIAISGRSVKVGELLSVNDSKKSVSPVDQPSKTVQNTSTVNVYPNISVNDTFEKIVDSRGTTISPTDLEKLATLIAEKNKEYRVNKVLYNPPQLSDKMEYIYRAKREIEGKVSSIVLKYGGGWAGVSLAPFESFWSKAVGHKLLPVKLQEDIMEFFVFVQPLLGMVDFSDQIFLEIQYSASHINDDLNMVLARTGPSKRGFEEKEEGVG